MKCESVWLCRRVGQWTNSRFLFRRRKISSLLEKSGRTECPYLPTSRYPQHPSASYKNQHELEGPLWGWTVETGTHALRLIFSGLFDKYPGVKIILGHLGETLPYLLWRLDSRWNIIKHPKKLKKTPSQYIRESLYVTTSGMCSNGPLACAIQELSDERVMFSVDYPYESSKIAAEFIEQAPFSKEVLEKICYKNAQKVLKL